MTQYQKGILVMDYLQELGLNIMTIGDAVEDEHLEQSYKLIQENPKITKDEFLTQMNIQELED